MVESNIGNMSFEWVRSAYPALLRISANIRGHFFRLLNVPRNETSQTILSKDSYKLFEI